MKSRVNTQARFHHNRLALYVSEHYLIPAGLNVTLISGLNTQARFHNRLALYILEPSYGGGIVNFFTLTLLLLQVGIFFPASHFFLHLHPQFEFFLNVGLHLH